MQPVDVARKLWRQCFHDPQYYEDFYFETVWPKNHVYLSEEKGMLHLNPYPNYIHGKMYELHYIVGVATDEGYRRQGVMTTLMAQALSDMWDAREPITYLMPADVKYYEPFGFVSVSEEKNWKIGENCVTETKNRLHLYSYEMLVCNFSKEQARKIFEEIDRWTGQQYCVTDRRDKTYFDLLYKEKACQNGNVVFVIDETQGVLGYFAYLIDEGTMVVEQAVWNHMDRRMIEQLLCRYYDGPIRYVESFPYMVRIVNVSAFLNAFPKECRALQGDKCGIYFEDKILKDNTGFYQPDETQENGRWIRLEQGEYNMEMFAVFSPDQLADSILGQNNEYNNNVFWGEIV